MSLTKRLYEEGYVGKSECKLPLLSIGKRFTIDFGNRKITQGTWEIISNKNAPFYECRRVLKNGNLSKSSTVQNLRHFHESEIYRTFK
jgi:hypothetical protein